MRYDLDDPLLRSWFRFVFPNTSYLAGVSAPFEVGEYWDRTAQTDVVGLREDGVTDLGECKWGAVRSAAALLSEIEAKAEAYPNPRDATILRRLFVRCVPRSPGASAARRWHRVAGPARLRD